MNNLKERAAKLESAVALRWFDRIMDMNDGLSAEIIFLLVHREILRKPAPDVWKRVDGLRDRKLLEMTTQELETSIESHRPDTTAHTAIFCYWVFADTPKECRAKGGEARLLEMVREWLVEVRPEVAEWGLSQVKTMLEAAIKREYTLTDVPREALEFVQGFESK